MYTTASVFFKTLADAGVSHAFVNWGSDHSAFLEDLQRQRIENDGKTLVEILTCPSEYVALSAAHGYAQVTGKPAAVIVHVDVGTQALAGAVHNADRGRIPVLIFAGAPPFSADGQLRGSRNEFMMWPQDIHDQPAIVRQYMRHTAEIYSGKHAPKAIMRALQIATSQPKGPVYLWARREITDEDVDEASMSTTLPLKSWPSVTMPALSSEAILTITTALLQAQFPLIVTSHAGRSTGAVGLLVSLSSALAIGVYTVAASAVCIPGSHPYHLGYFFGGKLPHLGDADVVLVIESDVPWIDVAGDQLREGAKVFVIDNDPLKRNLGWSHVDAELLSVVDATTALSQILDALRAPDAQASLSSSPVVTRLQERRARLDALRTVRLAEQAASEMRLAPNGTTPSVPFLLGALREAARVQTPSQGSNVLWLNEAATSAGLIWNHISPEAPGSMFMSGGTSLGYILGASIGASIGAKVVGKEYELIVAITGDGNFLFSVPTSAYWIARRYETPFLTVILNNGGWFSPKCSMRAVYPDGHGSQVSGARLTVGFGSETADYGGISAAAGGAWSRRLEEAKDAKAVFEEAVRVVIHERKCAVVECVIESI